EDLLKAKKPEAAVLELRRALAEVRDLDPGTLRDNLEGSLDKLLQQSDPHHGKRQKAAQEVGALFAALADRYAAAGLLRCARDSAAGATGFDPAGQAAPRQRIEQAIAAREAKEAQARAKELEPPAVDSALLQQLFTNGVRLLRDAHNWAVDANGVRGPALADGDTSALLPAGTPAAGRRFSPPRRPPPPGPPHGLPPRGP